MFEDVKKLLQSCVAVGTFEPQVLSLSPTAVREELRHMLRKIQEASSIVRMLQPDTWYVILSTTDDSAHIILEGKDLLNFKVKFPNFQFSISSTTKEAIEAEVAAFETKYYSAYLKECSRIDMYKRRLAKCYELKNVTLAVIQFLQVGISEVQVQSEIRSKEESTAESKLWYLNVAIKAAKCVEILQKEVKRRTVSNKLPPEGP